MPNTPNAEKKTLILTGASRGIGHATVKRFASAGWRVITCSRHAFPENCPWEMGPEDHIQVDLANPADTARSIGEMRERLKAQGSRLNALVNNAGISPKGEGGARLGAIETALEDWQHVFQVNFFAPIMLARGLIAELEDAKGAVVNVTSIAGRRVHPFAGAAYADLQSGSGLADARDGRRLRPARHPRQRHLAGRDRHRHPVAGNGKDRARADPAATSGRA